MGGLAMPRGWERQLRDAAGPPDRHFSTSARLPSPERRFVRRNATESSRFGLPLDPVAFQVGLVVPVVGSDQTRSRRNRANEGSRNAAPISVLSQAARPGSSLQRTRVVLVGPTGRTSVGTIVEPTPTHSANGGRPSDLASPVASYPRAPPRPLRRSCRGEVATHIPELAKADPGWFGILHGGEWRGSPDLSPRQPRTR